MLYEIDADKVNLNFWDQNEHEFRKSLDNILLLYFLLLFKTVSYS